MTDKIVEESMKNLSSMNIIPDTQKTMMVTVKHIMRKAIRAGYLEKDASDTIALQTLRKAYAIT